MSFSSRPSSCSSRMPQIAENEYDDLQENCVESRNIGNDNGSHKCYMPTSTSDFWDGSVFNGHKTTSNNGEIMFSTTNALETQDADFRYERLGLSHHLSLPSSSTKIATMEKFYQIQGSVPCKIRAKRGFATHPRSIAERKKACPNVAGPPPVADGIAAAKRGPPKPGQKKVTTKPKPEELIEISPDKEEVQKDKL